MTPETIRLALLSAIAAAPLAAVGCQDPAAKVPVPPPTELPRDLPSPDAAAPSPTAPPSASVPASASASLPDHAPSAPSSEPTPAMTALASPSATSVGAPEPPGKKKPADCRATKAYCIRAHTPPPTFGNVPRPPPGTPDATSYDKNGCVARSEMPTSCSGITFITGPTRNKGDCCYQVCQGPVPPCGRPFVVDGAQAVAAATTRADWASRTTSRGWPRDTRTRDALADAWLADARMEHASIASFARLSLELLAVGAPPALVEGAHAAARDEIEHARIAFGLASAIAGTPLGPLPFPEAARATFATTVTELVHATMRDGCVGETFAALVAGEGARIATSTASKEALATIARDETEHAAFAFRVVAWGLAVGGETALRAAERGYAEGRAALEIADVPLSTPDLRPYGRVDRATLAQLRAVAFRDVLEPALAHLRATLAGPTTSAPCA